MLEMETRIISKIENRIEKFENRMERIEDSIGELKEEVNLLNKILKVKYLRNFGDIKYDHLQNKTIILKLIKLILI